MLKIRFNRVGKTNRATFRIVVQEHTVAPGGRHVEVVGSYDPHSKKGVFKADKIKYWIDKGAQVSDSVYNLLVKENVIKGEKRFVKITKSKKKGKEEEESGKEEKEESGEKKEIVEEKKDEDPKKDTEDEIKKEEKAPEEKEEKQEEEKK